MNKKWLAIATAGIIALSASIQAWAADANDRRSITITGQGEVSAKSDTAIITFSVETMSPNAKAAARENANTMDAVRNAVIAKGADAKKIETQSYNVYPQDQYDSKGKVKSTTYRAENSLRVTVTDLSKTGDIIDAAIAAGANRVSSLDLTVSDTSAYEDQAIRKATEDAYHKAKIIAATLGKTVTNVISVQENGNRYVPYRVANVKLAARSLSEDASTPIEGGESKINSSVTIVFEIQ